MILFNSLTSALAILSLKSQFEYHLTLCKFIRDTISRHNKERERNETPTCFGVGVPCEITECSTKNKSCSSKEDLVHVQNDWDTFFLVFVSEWPNGASAKINPHHGVTHPGSWPCNLWLAPPNNNPIVTPLPTTLLLNPFALVIWYFFATTKHTSHCDMPYDLTMNSLVTHTLGDNPGHFT